MLSAIDNDNEQSVPAAAIVGVAGHKLTAAEKKLFAEKDPLGFILFARNIKDAKQVKALIKSLHECVGREAPVLIDQEGGRVQRLGPPDWPQYPDARSFGDLFQRDFAEGKQALRDNTVAIASDLKALGFNVNCAPVLDVLTPITHDIIGDRAFSSDPTIVAALGDIVCQSYIGQKIIPIIKHIPGHGQAVSDSHGDLPVVDTPREILERQDFYPFKEISYSIYADSVWGMTAHVIYTALDETLPATCSRKVLFDVVREERAFRGLLLSDDLEMKALDQFGDIRARQRLAIRAGCDVVLHCSGDMDSMVSLFSETPKMTSDAVLRYNRSTEWLELQN